MLGAVVFGHEQMQAVINDDQRAGGGGRQAVVGLGCRAAKDQALIDQVTAARRRPAARGLRAAPESRPGSSGEGDHTRRSMAELHPRRRRRLPTTRTRWQPMFTTWKRRSCAARSSPASRASTGATRAPSARSRSAPACCRGPTARRCSPAARRRRWWLPRWAPRATSRRSTRCRASTPTASCSTTTCRRTRPAKPGRVGTPKRREIGHGRLAKRALLAVLPTAEEFAYSMRVVSEITESNGSSSMASVCGGCLWR